MFSRRLQKTTTFVFLLFETKSIPRLVIFRSVPSFFSFLRCAAGCRRVSFSFWLVDMPLHLLFGLEIRGQVELRPSKLAKLYLRPLHAKKKGRRRSGGRGKKGSQWKGLCVCVCVCASEFFCFCFRPFERVSSLSLGILNRNGKRRERCRNFGAAACILVRIHAASASFLA